MDIGSCGRELVGFDRSHVGSEALQRSRIVLVRPRKRLVTLMAQGLPGNQELPHHSGEPQANLGHTHPESCMVSRDRFRHRSTTQGGEQHGPVGISHLNRADATLADLSIAFETMRLDDRDIALCLIKPLTAPQRAIGNPAVPPPTKGRNRL